MQTASCEIYTYSYKLVVYKPEMEQCVNRIQQRVTPQQNCRP